MVYDYRTMGATLDVEEAQLNEGGANAWDNCEPATLALIAKWYGNGDPYEPQSITDAVYGVNYHGGEMVQRLLPWFQSHYKYWPALASIDARDVIDGARGASAQAWPVACLWWCNSNGDIQPRNTGILHMSPIIYDDGANIGIFNIMRGQLVSLPYAQARAAYARQCVILERSVEELFTDKDREMLVAVYNEVFNPGGDAMRAKFSNIATDINNIAKSTGVPTAAFDAKITPKQ